MEVLESLVVGKFDDPERSEDTLAISDNYLALIDGATDKTGLDYKGRTAGAFLAKFLEAEIPRLDPNFDFKAALVKLQAGFLTALQGFPSHYLDSPPQAVLVIYSKKRGELWRLGDVTVLVQGKKLTGITNFEDILIKARSALLESYLVAGERVAELQMNDLGREMMLPLLKRQHLFANHPTHQLGYPAFTYKPVPDKYLEVFEVPEGSEVVLASDGYPRAFTNLELSEAALAEELKYNPLRLWSGTKGLGSGQVSFDDRAYLRFRS